MNYNLVIEFDNNRDYFMIVMLLLIGDNNVYIKIVVLIFNNIGGICYVILFDGSGNYFMYFFSGFVVFILDYDGFIIVGLVVIIGIFFIVVNWYGVGGLDNFLRIDGVSMVDNIMYNFMDGGVIQVGIVNFKINFEFDGYIVEVIVYNKEVMDIELI